MSDEEVPLRKEISDADDAGRLALASPTPLNTRRFLMRSISCFRKLFGRDSPLIVSFRETLKTAHSIAPGQLAPFVETVHRLSVELGNADSTSDGRVSTPSRPPGGKKVFVIHGHDELNTRRLKDLLREHFMLEPVLMMKHAGEGRALLKKYEDTASECAFAFALMTPDDIVSSNHIAQARPNVIFEAGWFVGRLGIHRVCILLKHGTTVHSDLDGISRIHFAENIEDKVLEIKRELNSVGL